MPEEYQIIHRNALEFLEKIIQKAPFKPKTVVAEEKELDNFLGKLEHYLRNKGEEYKAAERMTMRLRDMIRIYYWSDISKENWTLIYSGVEKLSNPEKITRESCKSFFHEVLNRGFDWLPGNTDRSKKDIEEAKKEFKKRHGYTL